MENASIINPALLRGLASAAALRGQFAEAANWYLLHAEHDPADIEARIDLAVCYYRMGSDYSARIQLENAITRSKGATCARASAILGLMALGAGDFANGWRLYAEHYNIPDQHATDYAPLEVPQWAGENLRDEVLLIRGEQGIGDEIMWSSLLTVLQEKFNPPYLLLECNQKLEKLFFDNFTSTLFAARQIVVFPRTEPAMQISNLDFQIPAASLGAILIKSPADFPRRRQWLKPSRPPARFGRAVLHVGFCWRSSRLDKPPADCAPAAEWAALARVPRIHCMNLQQGATIEEKFAIFDQDKFDDPPFDLHENLDILARLITELDLVIGPPNTVTYLAAALGVETWVLSFKREWILCGESSPPWFPAMQIFEKPWDEKPAVFFARIAEKLKQKIIERKG